MRCLIKKMVCGVNLVVMVVSSIDHLDCYHDVVSS